MATSSYTVNQDYVATKPGPAAPVSNVFTLTEGETVTLDDDVAAQIEVDSPGTLTVVP